MMLFWEGKLAATQRLPSLGPDRSPTWALGIPAHAPTFLGAGRWVDAWTIGNLRLESHPRLREGRHNV